MLNFDIDASTPLSSATSRTSMKIRTFAVHKNRDISTFHWMLISIEWYCTEHSRHHSEHYHLPASFANEQFRSFSLFININAQWLICRKFTLTKPSQVCICHVHSLTLWTPAYLTEAAAAYVRYDHLIVVLLAIDSAVVTSHSCWGINIRFRSSPWWLIWEIDRRKYRWKDSSML